MKEHIGMIGLGLMGTALTERLLGAGFTAVVYNRTRAKAEPLLARGVSVHFAGRVDDWEESEMRARAEVQRRYVSAVDGGPVA